VVTPAPDPVIAAPHTVIPAKAGIDRPRRTGSSGQAGRWRL